MTAEIKNQIKDLIKQTGVKGEIELLLLDNAKRKALLKELGGKKKMVHVEGEASSKGDSTQIDIERYMLRCEKI